MFRRLAIALLLIPLADALLLVFVASRIGAVPTVALVVLTALIGLMLVRAEGRHTLAKLQRKVAAGETPADELLDGALLLIAGAFLLTPGLVTDGIGFLLVLPVSRYPIRLALKRWVVIPQLDDRTGGFVTGRVYTMGFPDGGGGESRNDAVDLDDDAFDIDLEDEENGNA